MDIRQAANNLLNEWQLDSKGWTFKFNNRARAVGMCDYRRKTIQFSEHFIHLPEGDITNTLKHEIAHALAGYAAGHNMFWKQWAVKVGAKPERCSNVGESTKEAKYTLYCPKCWYTESMFRRPTNFRSCGRCFPGAYNDKYRLILTEKILQRQEPTLETIKVCDLNLAEFV